MAWNHTNPFGLDARTRGIAAIIVAVFLLSFSDALVKLAGAHFGLAQLVLLRSGLAAVLVLAACLLLRKRHLLALRRPAWVWARSLCLAGMWLCYYAGLPSMSFALAAACYYTAPVWMALMARLLLGAQIGARGWTAVALCLAGVLMVVNPGAGAASFALLLPMGAAVFYALAGTLTWARCREESAVAMALNLNLCLCAVAAVGLAALALLNPGAQGFVFALWPVLGVSDWIVAGVLGALLAVIAVLVALAYGLAPTPVVGVFDTAYLGFAALWAAVLFADVPSLPESIGIGLIALGAVVMSTRPSQQGAPER